MANLTELKGLLYQGYPFLATRDELMATLSNQSDNTATPFHRGRELEQLLVKRDGQIKSISLEGVNPRFFTSSVSLDNATEGLASRLNNYSQTKCYQNYEIETVEPGTIIRDISCNAGQHQLFCLTEKKSGQYFDLVAYHVDPQDKVLECLNYSKRFSYNNTVSHSGDVGALFHGLSFNSLLPEHKILIAVNGYQKTALNTFIDQVPCLIVAQSNGETLKVISMDLTEAVCVTASLAFLAVVTPSQSNSSEVSVTSLSRQINVNDVNTGAQCIKINRAINDVLTDYREILATSLAPPTPATDTPSAAAATAAATPTQVVLEPTPLLEPMQKQFENSYRLVTFYEDGLPYSSDNYFSTLSKKKNETLYIGFSTGLDFYTDHDQFQTQRMTSLPVERLALLQTVTGPHAALTRCPTVNGIVQSVNEDRFLTLLNDCRLPQFVVTDRWSRTVAASATRNCNGLIIMICDKMKDVSIEETLNTLNRDALCLAGPCSIVLVKIDQHFYWYRGVRWPGLVDIVPVFASDVTMLFTCEKLETWLDRGGVQQYPWPVLTETANLQCFYLPTTTSTSTPTPTPLDNTQLFDLIKSLSLEELHVENGALIDCLTQMSIMLTPSQLRQLSDQIQAILHQTLNAALKPINEEIRELTISLNNEIRELTPTTSSLDQIVTGNNRHLLSKLVGQRRACHRKLTSLTTALEQLTSQRASSSRKTDLKRLLRKTTIQNNVKQVGNMTREDFLDYLGSIDQWLILSLSDDLEGSLEYLGEASTTTFCQAVTNGQIDSAAIEGLAERCPELDGITVSALIEQSESHREHPLALSASVGSNKDSRALAVPMNDRSVLPIPIFECFTDPKFTPFFQPWTEIANDATIATYRIALRSTICKATCTRSFNISPASRELTFFLVYIFLTAGEKIVSCIDSPESLNADSTVTLMLKSLVGLALSTCASGTTPACDIFTLFGPHPKLLKPQELWILEKLATVFPYTGWPQKPFRDSLTRYCVYHLRNRLTDPATEALRREISKTEALAQKKSIMTRTEETQFVNLAIMVFFTLRERQKTTLFSTASLQQVAQTTLDHQPSQMLRKSSQIILEIFREMARTGLLPESDSSRDEILTNVLTRRSGIYQKPKLQLAENISNANGRKELEEIKSRLKEFHDAPRMQNQRSVDQNDQSGIKGDAELTRASYEEVRQLAQAIVDGKSQDTPNLTPTSAGDVNRVALVVHRPSNKAEAALMEYPGKGGKGREGCKGLELARRIKTLQFKDLQFEAISQTVSATRISLEDWQTVVETLLTGWRDNVAAAEQATNKLISLS